MSGNYSGGTEQITEKYTAGVAKLHELLSSLTEKTVEPYSGIEFEDYAVSWCPHEGCLEVLQFDGHTIYPVDHIEPEDVETVGDLKEQLSRWSA